MELFAKRSKKMKISTTTDPYFKHLSAEKAVSLISESGFEAIDLFGSGGIITWDLSQIKEHFTSISKISSQNNIEIGQCHAPFPLIKYDKESFDYLLNGGINSVYASAYMNCPYVVMHPGSRANPNNYQMTLDANVEYFSKLIPAMKDTGVSVCIENIFGFDVRDESSPLTPITRNEWFVELIDTLNDICGCEMFFACLDTGHSMIAGVEPHELVYILGKRLKVLHVHDNDSRDDYHWIPGIGKIDWEKFMIALKDVDYRGNFNFESDPIINPLKKPEYFDENVLSTMLKATYAIGRSLCKVLE
ncbi:MAG: sugar phosphate isomerase/epimerase [Ruminococcaceae bacterium]|nr:sugar phosphate isomerase/epimerase [Oscillospiraceae bacterium]